VALQHGVVLGSAGNGRIAFAAREDYALAAATVITKDAQAGRIYELAGDDAYTLAEFAAEIARQSGKPVAYNELPQEDFKTALLQAGLPEGLATLLAESDAGAAEGGLFDGSGQLSQLIGRATTPLAALVKAALKQ
jgi:NAD(P)H dehydrogenase (quinone)